MITATALDIIKLASKLAGILAVGQTPQAEDANDAAILLNSMLASWNQNRWLIWHLIDRACPSVDAKQSYSVGPGGDINIPQPTRPDRLQFAYVRLMQGAPGAGSGPLDFPLSVIETHEEYAAISLKSLQSWPTVAFYDATFPLGTLFVWPIPSDQFEIHILVRDKLESFDTLTTPFNMPEEYYEAILYNLAARLMLLYQLPMNAAIVSLAQGALNTVRVANHRVADLIMPAGLLRHGGWAMHGVGGIVEGTFTLTKHVLGPT